MKKWIFLLLISFNFISIQFVSATSGRTNSSGCHNSKNIDYHCHGAPKAKSITYLSRNQKSMSNSSANEKDNEIKNLVQGVQV